MREPGDTHSAGQLSANPADYVERRISSRDGLSLYLRDYNSGRNGQHVLICLGGLTRNSKDFHGFAQQLSDRYRIICPDYRGRGRSDYDPLWSNYTPPTYIDDVRQITAALNIHEFAIVGTSLGGLLAMGMSVAAPSALKGVLLNDVCPDLPFETLESIVAYAGAAPALPDWPAAAQYLHEHAPMMPSNADHREQLIHNTFKEQPDGKIVFDWDTNITRPIASGADVEMDLWPLYSALKDIPVLSIRGELSPFVTDQSWQKMAKSTSNLSCITVSETGHAPMLTEEICGEAIDAWLTRCFGS